MQDDAERKLAHLNHGGGLHCYGVQQPLVEVRQLAQRPRYIRLIKQSQLTLLHFDTLTFTRQAV